MTLDLTRPAGVEVFERLVRDADVVVENYTPRVMEQFGLGWDRLKEVNPRLVMVRMPAFGLDGPWRDRTGFAQTMECMSGMAWVTGFPDGPPVLPRVRATPSPACTPSLPRSSPWGHVSVTVRVGSSRRPWWRRR